MAAKEQVLCIVANHVSYAPGFNRVTPDHLVELIRNAGAMDSLKWIDRDLAETDERFLQLIPYVVMARGGELLSYIRPSKSNEKRLVGRRSIGLGGHINPGDGGYMRGLLREINEEVNFETTFDSEVVGMLYDPSTPVGRVHLGVVELWQLRSPCVTGKEFDVEWIHPKWFKKHMDELEDWSRFVMQAIHNKKIRL